MKETDLSERIHFQRWLDSHPPTNDPRYNAIRCHKKNWGAYMRWKFPETFEQLYTDFWLKRPDVWPEAYDSPDPNDTFP